MSHFEMLWVDNKDGSDIYLADICFVMMLFLRFIAAMDSPT